MQQKMGKTGWLAGASFSSALALFSVGAIGLTVAGCEEVESAVTCAALNNFRPTINVSATGEAGAGAIAVSRAVSGSSSIPSGVQVAGLSIEQDDVDFSGTGTGTVQFLVAIDSVVVGLATVNVTNGQVTSVPGELRLGAFDSATATAMINGLPVQLRASVRLPANSAEARNRTTAAVRSNEFQLTLVGQFTGNLNGTATLESIGFFCD